MNKPVKMKNLILSLALAASAAILAGCSTTHARETQLDMRAKTAALEPQDVRRTVEKMVDSMLADQEFLKEYCTGKPVLDVGTFKNATTMHLNMKSITDSIRTKLVRSRKFKFVDRTTAADDQQFMNDQALNGMTDPKKAVRTGRQSAAQMYIYGELSEMRSQTDGVTDRYFKFTLNMKDLRTGEIAWTDEKEIRKEEVKNVMGF